jgi:hypothetical protein
VSFLLLFFGIRLGVLALTLHQFAGGLLGLGYALLDLPARLAVHLGHAGASTLTHLPGVVGALLGLAPRLHGTLLGLASPLRGLARALHLRLDRAPADGCRVDHGRAQLPPSVASAGHQPCSVRRYLL